MYFYFDNANQPLSAVCLGTSVCADDLWSINYKRFSKQELLELRNEADYYEIGEIVSYLDDRMKDIEFANFEFSGEYIYNGQTAGTNKVEDLKDRSLKKGICATSPGWIVIELNDEWEFKWSEKVITD